MRVTLQDDGSWGDQQPVPRSDGSTSDIDGAFGQPVPVPGVDGSGGAGFDVVRFAPDGAGGYAAPTPLPEPVTLPSWEFNPTFTPDGRWLVFTAVDRDGGEGEGDLFAAPYGATLYLVRDGELLQVPVADTEIG